MPQFTLQSGDVEQIIDAGDEGNYTISVEGDSIAISSVGDQRFVGDGITYPQGYFGPLINRRPATPVYAENVGSSAATLTIDNQPTPTSVGTFDPASSGTVTVTDDGSFDTYVHGDDDDGNTLRVQAETLSEAISDPDGLITYSGRALQSQGSVDQIRVDVENFNATDQQTVSVQGDDDDGNTLDVAAETLSQAITDPDGIVTYGDRALQGQGSNDQLRVDLENNNAGTLAVEQQTPVALEDNGGTAISTSNPLSVDASQGGTVTVTDDSSFNIAGTVATEQQTPVGIEDTSGTQADPFDQQDTAQTTASDSGTGSANAATLDLGRLRKAVDIHVDTSGDATLTVEVSEDDGTTWRTFDTVSYTGASQEIEQYETAFRDIRAHLNQNRNEVVVVSRGV